MGRSGPNLTRVVAAAAALTIAASGCDRQENEPPPGGTPGAAGGSISTVIKEPEDLRTLNSNESEGTAVLDALYATLVEYDNRTSEPINQVAESIDTEDGGRTYTITIQDGWTFHDGTDVTAESFVRAWNYGAYGPNAMQNSGFFASIDGFDAVQCGTVPTTSEDGEEQQVPDCDNQPPTAQDLAGLEVVDDLTFRVSLTQPETFFPTRLGYVAYAPLPTSFYADPDAFRENPVGNGPFRMAEPWQHNRSIRVERFDDYAGEDQPLLEEIEFRIYDDINTAVNDLLAGNLDVVDELPPERVREVQQQIPDRVGESPGSGVNYIGFPSYVGFLQNADLRAALSMAIDREAITERIFDGSRQAANALVPPVIPGYQEDVCENWAHHPEEAKRRFEAAGGVDALPAPLVVWVNAGAGHEPWVEAVTNMWRDTLGIQEIDFQQLAVWSEYLGKLDKREVTGPFRLGWQMDYPHPQSYLQLVLDPDFVPPVGANSTFYDSEEFDRKLDEALAVTDLAEAIPVYQEAQRIACEDTPLAPVFFNTNFFAWAEGVNDLYVNAFGNINYTDVSTSR